MHTSVPPIRDILEIELKAKWQRKLPFARTKHGHLEFQPNLGWLNLPNEGRLVVANETCYKFKGSTLKLNLLVIFNLNAFKFQVA